MAEASAAVDAGPQEGDGVKTAATAEGSVSIAAAAAATAALAALLLIVGGIAAGGWIEWLDSLAMLVMI